MSVCCNVSLAFSLWFYTVSLEFNVSCIMSSSSEFQVEKWNRSFKLPCDNILVVFSVLLIFIIIAHFLLDIRKTSRQSKKCVTSLLDLYSINVN